MVGLVEGGALGVVAAAVMYPLLFAVARGRPLPPDVFAARLLRIDETQARVAGVLLQLCFGASWGLVMAWTVSTVGVVRGSLPIHGMLIGLGAFLLSLAGFATLQLVRSPFDWREWTGHFVNHLVFGLALGFLAVAWNAS